MLLLILATGPALAGAMRPVTANDSEIDTGGSSDVACSRAKYGAYQKLQDACVGWYGAAVKEAPSEYFVYVQNCDCRRDQSGTVTCGVSAHGSCTVDADRRALFGVGVTFDRPSAEREALRNFANYCHPTNHETVIEQALFGCNCAHGTCQKPGGAVS
jgi:hypothetical protein